MKKFDVGQAVICKDNGSVGRVYFAGEYFSGVIFRDSELSTLNNKYLYLAVPQDAYQEGVMDEYARIWNVPWWKRLFKIF